MWHMDIGNSLEWKCPSKAKFERSTTLSQLIDSFMHANHEEVYLVPLSR